MLLATQDWNDYSFLQLFLFHNLRRFEQKAFYLVKNSLQLVLMVVAIFTETSILCV